MITLSSIFDIGPRGLENDQRTDLRRLWDAKQDCQELSRLRHIGRDIARWRRPCASSADAESGAATGERLAVSPNYRSRAAA